MMVVELRRGKVWWWDVSRRNWDGTLTWVDCGWNLTRAGAVRRASKVC